MGIMQGCGIDSQVDVGVTWLVTCDRGDCGVLRERPLQVGLPPCASPKTRCVLPPPHHPVVGLGV